MIPAGNGGTDLYDLLWKLLIALAIGLLVGLQRERVTSRVAGVRTIPLAALLGCVCALLAESYGGWIFAAGLLAVAALTVTANLIDLRQGQAEPGMTTEIAVLLVFALGGYLVRGSVEIAAALGGIIALLLHLKAPLHGFASRIGAKDFNAILQFALITMVVLPILPDRPFGPFGVLNPRQIWWMVVLIVSISLAGYVAYRLFDGRASAAVAGLLGGLISSTATTVSYARRARDTPGSDRLAGQVILLSSAVVFGRVLLEIAVVAPQLLRPASLGLAPTLLTLAAFALFHLRHRGEKMEMPPQRNPSELPSALIFAGIYGLVLWLTAAVKYSSAGQALWLVAAASGLTDMDAITLSSAGLAKQGTLSAEMAWRLVLVASLSNLVFKGLTVAALGPRRLLRRLGWAYGCTLSVGALTLFFGWPFGVGP